jgi:hypothetical protein
MRFGKTYTAIRCMQEFYKRTPDVSKFSIICTAKPEVKDEWLKGINDYKTDYIDKDGVSVGEKATDDKCVERTFGDFIAHDLTGLVEKISEKISTVKYPYTYKIAKYKRLGIKIILSIRATN